MWAHIAALIYVSIAISGSVRQQLMLRYHRYGASYHVVCIFTPKLLLVPSYTALRQRSIGVNNLHEVVIRQRGGRCSNL